MRFQLPPPKDACDENREDVESSETWNGGSGTITFNYLQQRPDCEIPGDFSDFPTTTDPWGISS